MMLGWGDLNLEPVEPDVWATCGGTASPSRSASTVSLSAEVNGERHACPLW